MCGIAGVFSEAAGAGSAHRGVVAAMTAALTHRGPDGHGQWEDDLGRVVLGHRRLSIIDLGPGGAQPMVSAHGDAIVFNGEIYNYIELRDELRREGVAAAGASDTAVLLQALIHWGPDRCLSKLQGMFAFAWWRSEERSLFLARDRTGKKPLYYVSRNRDFYFASEIKALRRASGLNLEIDADSISHYLGLGFVPGARTIYRQVKELPAGNHMVIASGRTGDPTPYWRLPVGPRRKLRPEEAVEAVETRLEEAVRMRLRADVPVGTFLSGGIDSGIITGMAARHVTGRLKTFTVGFDGGGPDETDLARQVASRYGTDHQEVRLSADLDALLPEVVRAHDEPIADTSILPTYAIAREAARSLKVVLNGEGADEQFGGYRRHLAIRYYARLAPFARTIPGRLWRGVHALMPVPRSFRSPYAFVHRFSRGLGQSAFERYITWSSDGFGAAEKAALFRDSAQTLGSTADDLATEHSRFGQLDPLSQFAGLDFVVAMPDCLLVKLDMSTMAHSLEARCPFLDHHLVEWCAGLDWSTIFCGRGNKPLLRRLACRYLPPNLIGAPKRGFEIPLVFWMQEKLFDAVRETCLHSGGIVSDIFERRYVEALFDRSTDLEAARWANRVWILFMLALWDQEHNR